MSVVLAEAYRTRPIRFVELARIGEWRLKLYGASSEEGGPREELLQQTKLLAGRVLPRPAVADGRYGLAFACAHEGRDGSCYSMVDWWADENELHHQLFVDFEPTPPDALTACVWDIALMCFERRAWIEHVLRNPASPDVDGYLAATLTSHA